MEWHCQTESLLVLSNLFTAENKRQKSAHFCKPVAAEEFFPHLYIQKTCIGQGFPEQEG